MKRILLVEDEIPYIKLLHNQLTVAGYEVIEAYNGKTGFETAIKEKPDLIILDIRMPVMDGLTMLKKLRGDPWGKDVHITILTNLEDSESISTALDEKLSRYLIKSDSTLSSVIEEVKMILR
jgi:two-component system, OmpR family, alkaline phosphatase synthesis response regulator PhoP